MSLSGVVPIREGAIRFDGEPISGLAADAIVARGVVQVPEGRRIFPQMSVLENLQLGAYLRRNPAIIRQDLDMVMELFPILRNNFV